MNTESGVSTNLSPAIRVFGGVSPLIVLLSLPLLLTSSTPMLALPPLGAGALSAFIAVFGRLPYRTTATQRNGTH